MTDYHSFEGAREGLRQMAASLDGAACGEEQSIARLVEGAVSAEVRLKRFLALLNVARGAKLTALLKEMESATSKLAVLGSQGKKELAQAQALLLRETLKDIINECRRLRDDKLESNVEQQQTSSNVRNDDTSSNVSSFSSSSEPASARAARELAVEAARFVLWVREQQSSAASSSSSGAPSEISVELARHASPLVALAKQLDDQSVCRRATAGLIAAAKAALLSGGEMRSVREALTALEEALRREREAHGERFADVSFVRQAPDGQMVVRDEVMGKDEELESLEKQLDGKFNKWQQPFAQEAQYEDLFKQTLARRDARRLSTQVKRASSSAQVAAMRSNLQQQEENLAAQKKQLEALEAQLEEEEEEEDDAPQQFPEKSKDTRGLPTAGGYVVMKTSDKAQQIERQKTDTKIRPNNVPKYK